nr:hypothetical protein [uncultured bacterium]
MMDLVEQPNITWQAAHRACEAALCRAGEMEVEVAVALVDGGGRLIAFLRSQRAPFHCSEIAQDKAYTAAGFKLATHRWAEVSKDFSPAVAEGLRQRDRMVMFGGGFPILVNGECAGGIGVSGASEEQDMECAVTALNLIGADTESIK